MSDCQRTVQDARDAVKQSTSSQYFEQWDTYNTDVFLLGYKGPTSTAKVMKKYFPQNQDQVRILDVACGSGLVAEKLKALGFCQFVGVDGSQAMLKKARLTGLYQGLHLALLGTQPLPVEPGQFDVLTVIGFLHQKYISSVEVLQELCQAVKPGGLVVITRTNNEGSKEEEFTNKLMDKMRSMEVEGLWKLLEMLTEDHHIQHPERPGEFRCGFTYVYKRTS